MANTPATSGKGPNVTPNKPATNPTPATATSESKPTVESKRTKFTRLGGLRVGKALKAIDVIGNLAGSAYEYTQADINKISDALNKQISITMAKFAPKQPGQKTATNVFEI